MTKAACLAVAIAVAASGCDAAPGAGEGRVDVGVRRRSDDRNLGVTPRPFRFAVVGDAGTGGPDQYAVARRMCAEHDRRSFDLVVTTGDNVYPEGDPSRFDAHFFVPFDCLVRRGVEFRATLGNHDVLTDNGNAELADPRFGMPARDYTFEKWGVRFVMLDSNRPNLDFLERILRAHADARWTIAAFHHPVYSPGPHGRERSLPPSVPGLLRRGGVDLVLSGHDHLYAATIPMGGIRYVVTGGGGARLYACSPRRFAAICESRHHFVLVTVHRTRLVVRAIPAEGETLHAFSIAPTRAG